MTRSPKLPEVPEPRHLRKWLGWVVTERWDTLVRSARRWCVGQDPSAVEDVIHDGILKVLAGETELPNDQQRAWRTLLVTIRNVARNRYRTETVRRNESLDQVPRSAERARDGSRRGWRICERLERREFLETALERLTTGQREVVELRYCEEWTVAEVALHRGCTPDAVRKLAAKALATQADGPETADDEGWCHFCWNKCPSSMEEFCDTYSQGTCEAGTEECEERQCQGQTQWWTHHIPCEGHN